MTDKSLFLTLIMLFSAAAAFSQYDISGQIDPTDQFDRADQLEQTPPVKKSEDFWFSPGAEMAMYGIGNGAYGASVAIGYGTGSSIGAKAAFYIDDGHQILTLELTLLLRFYFDGSDAYSGPFLQFAGGPVIFTDERYINVPSGLGRFTVGLGAGYRILFFNHVYLEPAVRVGYPYIWGVGMSAGVRF